MRDTRTAVGQNRILTFLVWSGLAAIIIVPILIAAYSPYLASRDVVYIVAGFAGIIGLGLFLLQPLLAAGYLPGPRRIQRKWHRLVGTTIIVVAALHVGGLYLTSPPDTIDALLFAAPTSFSVFGVIAFWGIILTAVLVLLRRRLGLRYPAWHVLHNAIVLVVVASTVIHALQIEGTMGTISKLVLCGAALVATAVTLTDFRVIKPISKSRIRQATSLRTRD